MKQLFTRISVLVLTVNSELETLEERIVSRLARLTNNAVCPSKRPSGGTIILICGQLRK
jgi:hypothetical protein